MPNRIEARSAKAALTNATGRLPLLRLFSTPLNLRQPPPTHRASKIRSCGAGTPARDCDNESTHDGQTTGSPAKRSETSFLIYTT